VLKKHLVPANDFEESEQGDYLRRRRSRKDGGTYCEKCFKYVGGTECDFETLKAGKRKIFVQGVKEGKAGGNLITAGGRGVERSNPLEGDNDEIEVVETWKGIK